MAKLTAVPFRGAPVPDCAEVNVAPNRSRPGHYVVEVINYDGDGGVLQADFLPPYAKDRAETYATWLRQGRQAPAPADDRASCGATAGNSGTNPND